MVTVGLRDLRQNASALVRRVESGEEITVTVSGRPSARLVAVDPRSWRTFADVAELFDGPPDKTWTVDRDQVDHAIGDPWARR
ncbi:MAG TPA: type II toxin-antitoxin system prevent-host-death family antitoxin [Acidimicrobiales bacterium]|nr:type II toxin-antitoxin system prevent-host-death family antitoxin [Acidimicrobiales bacterium]